MSLEEKKPRLVLVLVLGFSVHFEDEDEDENEPFPRLQPLPSRIEPVGMARFVFDWPASFPQRLPALSA